MQHNAILLLKQLREQLNGHNTKTQRVRTIGKLKHFDLTQNLATIEDEGTVFLVDTSFIAQFHAKVNTWYTFSGEIETMENGVFVLQARIADEMVGMDNTSIKLWKQCLTTRNQYLS
jgi:hypothetical protein